MHCTKYLPSHLLHQIWYLFTSQAIYTLYIDFKNAFGFSDHARLLTIVEYLEYPQDVAALVANIYSQSTTTFIGEYFGKLNPVFGGGGFGCNWSKS